MKQNLPKSASYIRSVSVPCTQFDIKNIELVFQLWSDPRFTPSTKNNKKKPALSIVFNIADKVLINETKSLYAAYPKLRRCFSNLEVTSANLKGDKDVYHRDSSRKLGKYGNKAGPNFLFQKTLNTASKFGGFSLQIELDCFPSSAGWLDRCNRLVDGRRDCWIIGSKYAGSFGLAPSVNSHLNGNAIYNVGDSNFRRFLNEIWMPRLFYLSDDAPNLAYDCWWAYESLAADSFRGNFSWELVQTYDSFFRNEPLIINLMTEEATAARLLKMHNLFELLDKEPIFFHSSTMRPLVRKVLKKRNSTLLTLLEDETEGEINSTNPIDALSKRMHLMAKEKRTRARRKAKLALRPPASSVDDASSKTIDAKQKQDDSAQEPVGSVNDPSNQSPNDIVKYKHLALALIEELRHIIPELNKAYKERSDDLYLNNVDGGDDLFLRMIEAVRDHKTRTQRGIKHKISSIITKTGR